MRRILPAWAIALLVLTACTRTDGSSSEDDTSAGSALSSSGELPDPGPPCSLSVGTAEVGLTERQAITVTDLAAKALDAGATPRDLATRLPRLPSGAARALLGYDGPALSCVFGRALLRDQRLGSTGLTPRAERLRRGIRSAVGDVPMGGFASGGVSTGHLEDSAHYEGRAIDVFFRPHTDPVEARRGWVLCQWLVAHADRLRTLSVIYRDRIWTVWASYAGWRRYEHPNGPTTDPVLRHLDHVHTAVIGGPHRGDD